MARALRARQGDHEEELAELQRRFNALGAFCVARDPLPRPRDPPSSDQALPRYRYSR